jgi:hypothetical protein
MSLYIDYQKYYKKEIIPIIPNSCKFKYKKKQNTKRK